MKAPQDLSRDDLELFMTHIHEAMYRNSDGDLDPDQDVNGGDLVEKAGFLFGQFDMLPDDLEDEEE